MGGVSHQRGPQLAIVTQALVFALLHSNPADLPHLFVLGLLLGYLYERTGSLYAPIALHFINNAVTMLQIELIRQIPLA